jgi:hypothetical protein
MRNDDNETVIRELAKENRELANQLAEALAERDEAREMYCWERAENDLKDGVSSDPAEIARSEGWHETADQIILDSNQETT